MPRYNVNPLTEARLLERMEALGIREEDLEERFVRGTGSGGQKINKTSSAVQLVHKPSGIEVRCHESRSQSMNRFLARRALCDRLEAEAKGSKSAAAAERAKIRRQKARRARKTKVKMVEEKRMRGAVKSMRKKPVAD